MPTWTRVPTRAHTYAHTREEIHMYTHKSARMYAQHAKNHAASICTFFPVLQFIYLNRDMLYQFLSSPTSCTSSTLFLRNTHKFLGNTKPPVNYSSILCIHVTTQSKYYDRIVQGNTRDGFVHCGKWTMQTLMQSELIIQ